MIHLVVALPAEARPLVRHFRLQKDTEQSAFPLYRGDGMTLAVSGPGMVFAAAATAWLGGLAPAGLRAAWLNLGIAGHATHALGHGLLVNRITDRVRNTSWYPPQVHDLDLPASRLLCVEQPQHDYAQDTLYDMEAGGFYPAACRFTTAELVQCFKIVSDNRQHPATEVNAKLCTRLVEDQLPAIETLVHALGRLQQDYQARHAPHPEHERLVSRWHFTVSQQHRLARVLARWTALAPPEPLWNCRLEGMGSAAAVLAHLEARIDV